MTQGMLFPEHEPVHTTGSACSPRTPARIVSTITLSLDEMQPEEIIDYALEHIDTTEAVEAAYNALAAVWPGHYANALDFEERLRAARRCEFLPLARLALVPVRPGQMVDGETYLTAELGDSTLLARVLTGPTPKTGRLSLLFRIEKSS